MPDEVKPETHYEIQVRRGERWLIERVVPDRAAAFAMARELTNDADTEGVRIVKECYRPDVAEATAVVLQEQIRPPRPKRRLAVKAMPSAPLPAPAIPTNLPLPVIPPALASRRRFSLAALADRDMAASASIALAGLLAVALSLLSLVN